MKCRLVLQPEAEADLHAAYVWYEKQRVGLGAELITCVEAVFDRIRQSPELYAAAYGNVRQALVKRFPYVVCYVFEHGRVDVVAVFHGHRDPAVWKSRVGQRDAGASDENY
jgi:plasmid stabilization system protein ParE